MTGSAGEHVLSFVKESLVLHDGPIVIGLCGPQGSGKSTAVSLVEEELRADGKAVAVLSLDDLYLYRGARDGLAESVHPLFATRGVPGTHDVPLGIEVLDGLRQGGARALPRFDKGTDNPVPLDRWPRVCGPVEVVLFEGWCVGARPQKRSELAVPVNKLEMDEDHDARWRTYANSMLATTYRDLFSRVDRLILLAAPGFDVVAGWRREQEASLADRLRAEGSDLSQIMDDAAIARFVSHYERLTRHILAEMPSRADLVLHLNDRREVLASKKRVGA